MTVITFTVSVLCLLPCSALARWACARACPQSCSCTQEKSCSVLCDRSGLAELPKEFPCEASAINLDKNRLKFLSERAFGTLPSLKSLSLDHNNISFITPGAFKGLSNLVELKMAHNEYISYLHTRTFTGLKKLVRLDLSDCNLFNIPDRIFIEQTALKELLCFQNKFRRIPGAIRGMENLTHIYLERSKIEAVAYNSLLGLGSLKYLNLQENRINVIHDQAFQDLVRLENFYLNDNLLSDLPRLAFKGLGRLKMLNLGGNQLTNVSRTWFGDLVELEILYLDRNQLLYIEEGTFENLTSLITLHLNSNNLTALPFPVFQPIYFLGRLYLFKNPWECDCSLEWLKEWMESYNLVRDIPCASPSSVAGLDLSEVVFAKVNGTCVDPAELNLTTPSSEVAATTENRFNSLISKLLQQELREEAVNGTDNSRNGTSPEAEDGQLVAGVGGRLRRTLPSALYVLAAWLVRHVADV
ncbi:nyctalopin [Corythoichthys intestinalis]|uniref:nyctalopin n=1 Tax=Corythoichthys intestinalis TaxID=161448 RepID=UPI0025A58107|nr:nyctalopin [Corythoichthys intestinalis]XP_057707580.1 nyctalopin [Corythoichthys intestinalis]XP_061799832.1 nyctalopin-like [Nerophis lumbriciformis]